MKNALEQKIMNNLSSFRRWLIAKIAGDEPMLLNWNVNPTLLKGDASVAYIPMKKEKIPRDELMLKAVLTPVRNAT